MPFRKAPAAPLWIFLNLCAVAGKLFFICKKRMVNVESDGASISSKESEKLSSFLFETYSQRGGTCSFCKFAYGFRRFLGGNFIGVDFKVKSLCFKLIILFLKHRRNRNGQISVHSCGKALFDGIRSGGYKYPYAALRQKAICSFSVII